jgi:hypothetical protein
MQQEELLRKELLAEIESIAPVVAEHAAASEALGRLDEPTMAALREHTAPTVLVSARAGWSRS